MMRYWLVAFMFSIASGFFWPAAGFAHSYVEDSEPGDEQTVEEAVEIITLNFDAGIESHTTITVKDREGNEFLVADEEVNSPVYEAHLEAPLYEGQYTVEWEALGEDGHTTEGTLSFAVLEEEVDEENEEDIEESEETVEAETDIEETEDEMGAEDETASEEKATNEGEDSAFFWWILGGFLVLGGAGFVFVLTRR